MKFVGFYTIFLFCSLNAIDPRPIKNSKISKSPILKSLAIPGLGELSLGKKNRAKLFGGLEIALWLLVAESVQSKKNSRSNMISYAAIHAGASLKGKDHQFALDVANYLSVEDFNQEQQRMRLAGRVYNTDDYNWQWDSQDHREQYWNYIRRRAKARKIEMFSIGGMIVNRIVSGINVSYLNKNKQSKTSIKFIPLDLNESIKAPKLMLFIDF